MGGLFSAPKPKIAAAPQAPEAAAQLPAGEGAVLDEGGQHRVVVTGQQLGRPGPEDLVGQRLDGDVGGAGVDDLLQGQHVDTEPAADPLDDVLGPGAGAVALVDEDDAG